MNTLWMVFFYQSTAAVILFKAFRHQSLSHSKIRYSTHRSGKPEGTQTSLPMTKSHHQMTNKRLL